MASPGKGGQVEHSLVGGAAHFAVLAVTSVVFVGVTGRPAAADVTSPFGTLSVVSASLVAKGAAVDVVTEYSCVEGMNVSALSSELRQASGKRLANGFGFADVDSANSCFGLESPQTATIRVFADLESVPFKKGTAIASANLFFCSDECFNVFNDEVLRIG